MKVKKNWLPDDVRFSDFNNIFCYFSWIWHPQDVQCPQRSFNGTKESSDLVNFFASQGNTTTFIMIFCTQLNTSPILTSRGNTTILADSSLFFEFHWFLSPSASTGSELMIFTNLSLKFNQVLFILELELGSFVVGLLRAYEGSALPPPYLAESWDWELIFLVPFCRFCRLSAFEFDCF